MKINHVILKNQFDGKDTTIVGDVINNGCQTFNIDKIDEVCIKFNVSDKQKQQAVDAHSTINSSDFTNLFDCNCPIIIGCLLHQGVYSDRRGYTIVYNEDNNQFAIDMDEFRKLYDLHEIDITTFDQDDIGCCDCYCDYC